MNKVMLIGNVGQEPQVKYIDQGICVAQVRLATTERGYTLQNGAQVPERTEWHNCIFWRKQAEVVEKYVHKGDKLYVEGKIQSRDWVDKRGISHKTVDITVDNMELLTPKGSQSAAGGAKPVETPQQPVTPSATVVTPSTPGVVTPQENGDDYPF